MVLAPHMNAISNLQGSSWIFGEADEDVRSLMRWEACWSCMPNLQCLVWECPASCLRDYGDALAGQAAGFGLPPGLQTFELKIRWDPPAERFSLEMLSALEYRNKVTSLSVAESLDSLQLEVSLDLTLPEQEQFPVLRSLSCSCTKITGNLNAPNLSRLRLTVQRGAGEVIAWENFAGCHVLQDVSVCTTETLNCRGCSFPRSLQTIVLKVGALEEDGCFRELVAPGMNLSCIQASIGHSRRNAFDFTPFTDGTRLSSLRIKQGKIELAMPPALSD